MKASGWPLLSLGALWSVTASPIILHRRFLEQRGSSTVTEQEFTNLELYAQWAGAAYCNSGAAPGALVTCGYDVCPDVEASNATVVGTLYNDTLTNQAGFVAVDPTRQQVVLSLRGSDSVRNWLTDFLFALEPCNDDDDDDDDDDGAIFPADCLAHAGFLTAWSEVRSSLLPLVTAALAAQPSYALIVTGHSLGAGVATLAAAHLRAAGITCDLYTYGSPRVGNAALVDFLMAQDGGALFRVTHADDPVPRLPPLVLGYRHTSPEYWINETEAGSYAAGDVVVCEGTANVQCNAGTTGLDVSAHRMYFEYISACGAEVLPFRTRREEGEMSDEELAEKVSLYAALDVEYANALAEGSQE